MVACTVCTTHLAGGLFAHLPILPQRTATCPMLQGITTAVALHQGFGSPLFAACLCFSVIVMYDAMGVRRHAGERRLARVR